MNYSKLYYRIIELAKNREKYNERVYYENHHIVPRSLGGSDDPVNIVRLTSREHFICHYLLTKMYKKYSNEWYKVTHAFMFMISIPNCANKRYVNSRLYENIRKSFPEVMSKSQNGAKNSQYGKKWIYNETIRESKKIEKNSPIPDGWNEGRVINWGKYYDIKRMEREKIEKYDIRQKNNEIYAKKLYDEYINGNYRSVRQFVKESEYPYSHVSLTALWKQYILEYQKNAVEGIPYSKNL